MNEINNLSFTKEEFIRQYSILSTSSCSEEEKKIANLYIIKFDASEKVWQISLDMIADSPSAEIQSLGAQILCKKLKNNYFSLGQSQLLELRNFFFQTLTQNLSGKKFLSRISKTEIILSISVLGFTGIYNEWQDFISDICTFMKLGNDEFILSGLEILENIGSSESMQKVVPDLKLFNHILSLFQSQMNNISSIFNELLIHSNSKIGLKTLDCIESWAGSQFKYQVLLDENLVNKIFLLFRSREDAIFTKVAKIILQSLSFSKNSDVLLIANAKSPTQLNLVYSFEETTSLKLLIDSQIQRIDEFIQEKDPNFCRYFAEITIEIAKKFPFLILEKSEHSFKLLQLVLVCTQHQNLLISYLSFDFWIIFQSVLEQNVSDIKSPSSDWLISPYLDVFSSVLEKCKLPSKIQQNNNSTFDSFDTKTNSSSRKQKSIELQKKYEILSEQICQKNQVNLNKEQPNCLFQFLEDDSKSEDLDCSEEMNSERYFFQLQSHNLNTNRTDLNDTNMEVKDYRIYSQDIFNITLNVMSDFRGSKGVQLIFQILYNLIDKNKINNYYSFSSNVEVCLFTVQAISSSMAQKQTQGNEDILNYFFNFIVNNPDFPANQDTLKMGMQLFQNAQLELKESPLLFDSIVQFLLKYILDERLCLIASQTFSFITKEQGKNVLIETFKYVAQFFVNNIDKISQLNVLEELISGVFGLALSLQSNEHQIEAISFLLIRIQSLLENTKLILQIQKIEENSTPFLHDPHQQIKNLTKKQENMLIQSVSVFQSLLSAFSSEQITLDIKTIITQFVQENFNFLTRAFDLLTLKPSRAYNTINQFISIFRFVTKIFNSRNQCNLNNAPEISNLVIQSLNVNEDLFYDSYIDFLNISFIISQRNPILFCETMKIFQIVVQITNNIPSFYQKFSKWLDGNLTNYNQFYLSFLTDSQLNLDTKISCGDPDLIINFFQNQIVVIRHYFKIFVNQENFKQIMQLSFQLVSDTFQYEIIRLILDYFTELVKASLVFMDTSMQNLMIQMLEIVVDIFPNCNNHLLHQTALFLMKFVELYKDDAQKLLICISHSFSKNTKYQQFTEIQINILCKSIIKYSLENPSLNSLKSLLTEFNQVCKYTHLSPSDIFIKYERLLIGQNFQK